jgi:hypothetical protein
VFAQPQRTRTSEVNEESSSIMSYSCYPVQYRLRKQLHLKRFACSLDAKSGDAMSCPDRDYPLAPAD